jgi:hypothetical protein
VVKESAKVAKKEKEELTQSYTEKHTEGHRESNKVKLDSPWIASLRWQWPLMKLYAGFLKD